MMKTRRACTRAKLDFLCHLAYKLYHSHKVYCAQFFLKEESISQPYNETMAEKNLKTTDSGLCF